MNRKDLVNKLPALPVRDVMDILFGIAADAKNTPEVASPLVSVVLSNASVITGYIVVGANDRQRNAFPMLIAHADSQGRRSDAVTYLDLNMVCAVTVHNVEGVAVRLAKGAIDPLDLKEAPGRLSIDREAQDLGKKLSAEYASPIELGIVWEDVDVNQPKIRAAAHEALKLTADALTQLAKDSFAKDSVRSKVKKVAIMHGTARAVNVKDAIIMVALPFDGQPEARFTASTIEQALNAVL